MAMVLAFAGVSHAASTTATMNVGGYAQSLVQLYVVSHLDFGTFENSAGTAEATGQIEVTAPVGLTYDVTIDAGYFFSGASRRVEAWYTYDYLAYNVYQDAAHSIEWGDSSFGDTYPAGTSLAGTGTGAAQTYTVYGVLTKNDTVPQDYYFDYLTVTAIW